MAQIVYYFWAALKLGAPERPVAFTVPTGNFGNVYAGYAARQMGLPVSHFVVAANSNDILARFFEQGAMTMTGVVPTLSPSMDIQVSSNFERLLFDLYGRDGKALADAMTAFRSANTLKVGANAWGDVRELFDAGRVDDERTIAAIADCRKRFGETIDPHTAVGYAVAQGHRRDPSVPMVVLATAHPAKFPDAVEKATGERPALPPRLADLLERTERMDGLPNDAEALKAMIEDRMPARRAARTRVRA
jgi:threonine synthase